jgi:hypothetical protein
LSMCMEGGGRPRLQHGGVFCMRLSLKKNADSVTHGGKRMGTCSFSSMVEEFAVKVFDAGCPIKFSNAPSPQSLWKNSPMLAHPTSAICSSWFFLLIGLLRTCRGPGRHSSVTMGICRGGCRWERGGGGGGGGIRYVASSSY